PSSMSHHGTVVVGYGVPPGGGRVATRWTATTGAVNLGALPNHLGFPDAYLSSVSADGSVATGNSFASDGVHPLFWSNASGLTGLGDVPGGEFYALGFDISANGKVIVGNARTSFPSAPDEAFLWRQGSGFELLDPHHGQFFGSTLYGVSGDGSVAVGYSGSVNGGAMVWTTFHGMRSIRDILTVEHGLDLAGWQLGAAWDVSRDGTTMVGTGVNPQGNTEGWLALIPRGRLAHPWDASRQSGDRFGTSTVPEPIAGMSAVTVLLMAQLGTMRRGLIKWFGP
ncbi:MAG TPA: hypothetical protein VIY86_07490, partial [Pirellulaceae bacterium]